MADKKSATKRPTVSVETLLKQVRGLATLPKSAAGKYQKPVDNFAYKPSDEETRRDIEADKILAPIQREAFMKAYLARTAPPAPEEKKVPKMDVLDYIKRIKQGEGIKRELYTPTSDVDKLMTAVDRRIANPLRAPMSKEEMFNAGLNAVGMAPLGTTANVGRLLKTLRGRKADKLDLHRPIDEYYAVRAIEDASKLAKSLKVNERLRKSPTPETVDKLLHEAEALPTTSSYRSKQAVRELINTYILPAQRRIEYNTATPEEIAKNLQSRGIFNEKGELAEGVERVIRGQKVPYSRLRTPTEIQVEKYDMKPETVPNQAVYASRNPDEANVYSKVYNSDYAPVSYPMYVRTQGYFDNTDKTHVDRLRSTLADMRNNKEIAPEHYLEYVNDIETALRKNQQPWGTLENPALQKALKTAGFRGMITDEGGYNYSNFGAFDVDDFLSIFSHGKPGVSDIQSVIPTLSAGGLAALVASNTSDNDSETKE